MSPLADPAVRGYQDMQRVSNWDSQVLFNESNVTRAGNVTLPTLDVSRYEYLVAIDQSPDLGVQLDINWFEDAALTQFTGERRFQLSPLVNLNAQYRLTNLGDYVTVTYAPLAAGNWRHSCNFAGSNRSHPLEFLPIVPVLIDQQNAALGAGATVTLYPQSYSSGPAAIWTFISGASTALIWAEYLNQGGTWSQFQQVSLAAGNTSLVWTMPPGAWRINLKNNNGAAAISYYLAVTPSTTGAI